MDNRKKIAYYKNADGKIVPYVSNYTQSSASLDDVGTSVTEEFSDDYDDDEFVLDYDPGIDIPDYGMMDRDQLPQIDYVPFYNDYGPDRIVRRQISCTELEPTQGEFNEQKVLDMISSGEKPKPILVSKDNKIIDGHHRWLAAHNMGYPAIEVNQVDSNYDDFMEEIKNKPYVKTATIKESMIVEAEYQGKTVKLGKPFRTPGQKKKFAVYVQNNKGKTIIVRFGDPNMSIKRDDPERRKNFRARHNCASAKDRTKPSYWSCKFWSKPSVSSLLKESDEVIADILESTVTPELINKKEKIFQAMKRDVGYFKKKYGKDYKNIMYAISMAVAKKS